MKALKVWIGAIAGIALVIVAAALSSEDFRGFLKRNWGNLASVAGLGLSFLAALFSSRASEAAREARDYVVARTLEQEVGEGYKAASDLTMLVEIGRLEIALSKCSDLLDVPNRIRIRWDKSLETSSKNNFLLARQQLESIHSVLRRIEQKQLAASEAERLHKACIDVRTIFADEEALIQRNVDRGENAKH